MPVGPHVAVLMGGWSAERPVSLSSGKACADALERAGYRVTRLDVQRDIAARLAELRPDVAFNALHGPFGEDGCIQGILEVMDIPYTHSGVMASALAMNKDKAKAVLREVVEADERVLADPAPNIAVTQLADSSVNLIVRPWVATGDYWGVYWDLTEAIKKRFDKEEISIPFPQRDVHLYPAAENA